MRVPCQRQHLEIYYLQLQEWVFRPKLGQDHYELFEDDKSIQTV